MVKNWKKRISECDKYIDMQGHPYYHISFDQGRVEEYYGIKCRMPDEPADEHCVNYGLDIYDQVFRKTFVPDQVRFPDRDWGRERWTEKEMEAFIDHQWNIRKNGVWFWIKGKKVYIPGQLWFKYNLWTSSTGEEFEYRTHERELFSLLFHLQRDPIDLGLADFKCRQLGDTEMALVVMYERGSRIRGSLTTMQSSINEDHIIETYNRLIHGHKNMIWYMKPMNTGTENPRKGLILDYPTKHLTHAEISRQQELGNTVNKSSAENYQYPPIGSRFRYGPTKVKHFDGATGVLTAYNDEYGKCFSGDTRLLMFDGSYKRADKIKVGDVLMGDDGTQRVVEKTYFGYEDMYKISPRSKTFEPYVVTGDHTIVMKWAKSESLNGWRKDQVVEMSVHEFLQSSGNIKKHMTLFKTGIEYVFKEVDIDPYLLGVWLGDGSHVDSRITNSDPEVKDFLKLHCDRSGMIFRGDYNEKENYLRGDGSLGLGRGSNPFLNSLRSYNLLKNKHIPTDYLINSRDVRLRLLAGLIDTDGSLHVNGKSYEITQKRRKLSVQIHKLIQELGFKSSINTKIATMKRHDGSIYRCKVYRISIFGKNLHDIPCRVERKKVEKRTDFHKNTRDSMKTTFTVEKQGVGKYFGFVTGGNNRVVLRDCQVAHNSETMSPVEWIQTMVETVFSNIRGRKRGILIMTSTVEDISEDSLEWAMQIYKESDPNKRKSTGSTVNRLVRIFRGVADRGFETIVADRWGDIDREAVIAAVTEQYNAFIEAGNTKGAMSFLRKNPRTIDDVFLSVRNQSSFNTEDLAKREFYLNEVARPKPYVRGNFKWKDGVRDSEVIWEPNENGRWLVSKHPSDFGLQSNARSVSIVASKPGNAEHFCCGVDPVDQSKTLENIDKVSKMGIVVMKKLDYRIDSEEHLWHKEPDEMKGILVGDPVSEGEHHSTNRVVCTYIGRDKDIFNNFEDLILTATYYGTEFLPENNKAGALKTYLRTRKYDLYLTDKPSLSQNYKGQFEKDGVTASEKTFGECFSFIETYTYKWFNAIDHPDLTTQLLTMNWGNRGERDLGVAFGWCLYHSYQQSHTRKIVKHEDGDDDTVHFYENYV